MIQDHWHLKEFRDSIQIIWTGRKEVSSMLIKSMLSMRHIKSILNFRQLNISRSDILIKEDHPKMTSNSNRCNQGHPLKTTTFKKWSLCHLLKLTPRRETLLQIAWIIKEDHLLLTLTSKGENHHHLREISRWTLDNLWFAIRYQGNTRLTLENLQYQEITRLTLEILMH